MERNGTKIAKACEPCRRRKIKCNGQQPCGLCQQNPTHCSYRAKARDRTSAKQRAVRNDGHGEGLHPTDSRTVCSEAPQSALSPSENHQPADPEVYRGITATHTHGSNAGECAQLFYGPSSNFAFLQQLHKGVLYHGFKRLPEGHDDQEGAAGLDMFVQRSIFFGTPSLNGVGNSTRPCPPAEVVSATRAHVFLQKFKVSSLHLVPLFTETELDRMLRDLYQQHSHAALQSQEAGVILAVLANGALSSNDTDSAERLYERAKAIGVVFDEAVTLAMIHLSLLLSDYQINMGRPNSAYLHLGTATRRGLAMGLTRESSRAGHQSLELQKRRSTMWSLYFHERWHALAMGRASALKFADITCQFPEDCPVLRNFCEIARIAEFNAEEMYQRKSESLQLLYATAERTYTQLRQFAERAGIGAMDLGERAKQYGDTQLLHLHSVYYHAIILTFRPFLVAMAGSQHKQGLMWLRAACRKATDAAQDSLTFISTQLEVAPVCRDGRYTAFFIESSCAVLLYDGLWHPTKLAYNLEFVRAGLGCLNKMVDEEPILNARNSISRAIGAVEIAVATHSQTINPEDPDPTGTLLATTQAGIDSNSNNAQLPASQQTMFGSMANDFIYLSDRPTHAPLMYQSQNNLVQPTDSTTSFDANTAMVDPTSLLDFDVLTTDLYNFFPISTPRTNADFGHGGQG